MIKKENFKVKVIPTFVRQEMRTKKVWNDTCPISIDRLRIIKFAFFNFEDREQLDGEMVALDAVSDHVLAIFKELHQLKFPLSKARRIEFYNGDDEASMNDNNSSCFNHREITGGGTLSLHSYGVAIDINPILNPCIMSGLPSNGLPTHSNVIPSAGYDYINRQSLHPGMVETKNVIEIFKKHGFSIWGGQWKTPIDWQHFQTSRATAQLLATMEPSHAYELFNLYSQEPSLLNSIDTKNNKFVAFYQKSPNSFMKLLRNTPNFFKMKAEMAYSLAEKAIN